MEGNSEEVAIEDPVLNSMKEELTEVLNKLVRYESAKKCSLLAKQLEEKIKIVHKLEKENSDLLKKQNNFDSFEEEICALNIDKKNLQVQLDGGRKERLEQVAEIQRLKAKVQQFEQFEQKSKNIYVHHQQILQRLESRVDNNVDGNLVGVVEATTPANNGNLCSPPVQDEIEPTDNNLASKEPVQSSSKSSAQGNNGYNALPKGNPCPFVCIYCGRDFFRDQDRKTHVKRMHQKLQLKGSLDFQAELRDDDDEGRTPEESQAERFRDSESLTEVGSSSGLKTLHCSTTLENLNKSCNQVSEQLEKLEDEVSHGGNLHSFVCSICNKHCASEHGLKIHTAVHKRKTFKVKAQGNEQREPRLSFEAVANSFLNQSYENERHGDDDKVLRRESLKGQIQNKS